MKNIKQLTQVYQNNSYRDFRDLLNKAAIFVESIVETAQKIKKTPQINGITNEVVESMIVNVKNKH